MWIEIVLLVLAVPVGFLVAYLANDELVAGRKWFKWIIIASFLLACWFALIGQYTLVYTLGFILVVSFISYLKSFDKNLVKRRV